MLDIKRLRTDLDKVKQALVHRGEPLSDIEGFAELDSRRRELLTESESLKNRRNVVSQEVARKKRAGEAADDLIAEMREVGDRIKRLDDEVRELEQRLEELLLSIPNVPHESVPVGASDADNVEVRRWGDIPEFSFAPAAHWEIAAELDILDFERAAKVAGSRFVFLKRAGARLERALIQWMLDVHVDRHGYVEMMPPYIVNEDSLRGTGQLPKFAEDVFRLADSDYYLIPTAEVPVTNYHRNEILSIE